MIDYKFKEGDWFSTEGLTEDEVKKIAEEIYQQGFPDYVSLIGGERTYWDWDSYSLFEDKGCVVFGPIPNEYGNKINPQEILKQIKGGLNEQSNRQHQD